MTCSTGLIYFGKRFYDPQTFTWMTPDPMEDIDGPNYYAYVKNNPLYYVDPDGRWVMFIPIAIEIFSITWGASTVITTGLTMQAVAGTLAGAALGVVVHQVNTYCDQIYYKGREGKSSEKGEVRTEPQDLGEQLTLEEAKANSKDAKEIMRGKIKDERYPEAEWAKKEYIRTNPDGTKTNIHYWEHRLSGATHGYKFK